MVDLANASDLEDEGTRKVDTLGTVSNVSTYLICREGVRQDSKRYCFAYVVILLSLPPSLCKSLQSFQDNQEDLGLQQRGITIRLCANTFTCSTPRVPRTVRALNMCWDLLIHIKGKGSARDLEMTASRKVNLLGRPTHFNTMVE